MAGWLGAHTTGRGARNVWSGAGHGAGAGCATAETGDVHQARRYRVGTIIQFWVNAGMPEGAGSKASYEAWAAKLSGLFDLINVRGFLATPKDRRPEDPDVELARKLFVNMDRAHRGMVDPSGTRDGDGNATECADWSKPVRAGDVVDLVNARKLGFDFGFKDERKMMGSFLTKFNGRIFEFDLGQGRQIVLQLTRHTSHRWATWFVERRSA